MKTLFLARIAAFIALPAFAADMHQKNSSSPVTSAPTVKTADTDHTAHHPTK